jgi:hypothetical protein
MEIERKENRVSDVGSRILADFGDHPDSSQRLSRFLLELQVIAN